jgi:hypothetical protein
MYSDNHPPRARRVLHQLDVQFNIHVVADDRALNRAVPQQPEVLPVDPGGRRSDQVQSTLRSMLAMVGRPVRAIAISNSRRRMSTTRVTPASPATLRP